ncbi:uncharacterized protein L203_102691 [Cryptococcus depauperatus CBS 7841]|uniref:Uncharacterized protein n=1 Tax=Cryptococcus depauperatus CBS 7841 TaxID=1295531 RepID=A0A1E3HVB0_9TREE|nr:hypothetical protein L203_05912 [Cryptococcus depauperatus CBS 7841]
MVVLAQGHVPSKLPQASSTLSLKPLKSGSNNTLHLRLLFPHLPAGAPVPQLIKGCSNDIDHLNQRLYHLEALALRAYIQSWYTRFTSDRTLLPLIHSTVLHPLLSQVLNRVYEDPQLVAEWALLSLPILVGTHVKTYWQARAVEQVLDTRIADAYHARLPLLSVERSVDGDISIDAPIYTLSSIYLSALATAMLPTQQPKVQLILIREVIARSVLAGGLRRPCFGWFWCSIILRFLGEPEEPAPWCRKFPSAESPDVSKTFGQVFLLYITTYFAVLKTIYSTIVSIFAFYTASPPAIPKYRQCTEPIMEMMREGLGVDGWSGTGIKHWRRRIVWGGLEMIVGISSPWIDRIIPHLLECRLKPALSFHVIDITERLLFPLDGYPGPPPIDPSNEEAIALRIRAEKRIYEIIPYYVKSILCLGQEDIQRLLAPITDAGCNAHLMGMILESLVALLIPDLVLKDFRQGKS